MLYPVNISEKLGFTEIKERIKEYCLSEMGRDRVEEMQFYYDFLELEFILKETLEFKTLVQFDDPFPSSGYYNILEQLAKIKTLGSYLDEEELDQVMASFRTIFLILVYFKNREGKYPLLQMKLAGLELGKSYHSQIEKILDPTGKLRTNASKEYEEIHRKINALEKEAQRTIQGVFSHAQKESWTGDGNLTIRNGRLCIPLLAENKRRVKGFIQDESATGQTVFIEPAEVFEINNEIRDLEFHKKRERIKILQAMADSLRPNIEVFIRYHEVLSIFDFIRAKAFFAIETESNMPKLIPEAGFRYQEAFHPLLFLNLKKEGKKVVPLNIQLNEKDRIILVSGPNAGGKSVCLKTVGLLQVMIQSGLLIPAKDNSEVGLFHDILIDIGDDQSIESDLSTYSAHLTNMRTFMERANEKALVLIDEFGTGTDPQFGGPIAEAVLEELNQKNVKGLITTHYSNLKIFAGSEEGILNASMLFDSANLRPLYQLEIGKPGSSYAFEIAEKIGLPSKVIQSAKDKISIEQKKVEELLSELEREKIILQNKQIEIHKMQKKYNFLVDENEKLKEFLDNNKGKLIKEAKKEAESIILNANKAVEKTIRDIKTGQAEKIRTQESRSLLKQELEKVKTEKILPKIVPKPKEEGLKSGDWVRILDQDTLGQIISIQKENAILSIGDLRSVVKLNRLERASRKEEKKIRASSYTQTMTENALAFSPELDVRGMRGEEALFEVEKYLDRALMMGISQFKVIHGKGDGILRKRIREYLKGYKNISSMEDEHADRGGDGITYVHLKG